MRMNIRILLIGLGVMSGIFSSCGQTSEMDSLYNDGPYIFFENGRTVARWIEDSQVKADTLENGEPLKINANVSSSFDPAYLKTDYSFLPERQDAFTGVTHFVAVSDIHGQYGMLKKLLQAHRVIDEGGNWIYGTGHLVIVGDVVDRGDEVTEILWMIHKLEQQAEKVKGKVHYLLGNHEVMVMMGDLRYIHKKYRYTSAGFKMSYQDIFGVNSYLGRWLRSKPVAISINKTIFAHAGFSEQYLQLGLTNKELNKTFREEIFDEPEDSVLANPKLNILYNDLGPVWYRGYFAEDFTEDRARAILQKLGKKNIVVGHTSFAGVVTRYRHKIIGVDSSIKFGKTGELLLYEKKRFYRGLLSGEKQLLE